MDKNLFSGLENLGFKDVERDDLFKKPNDNTDKNNIVEVDEETKIKSYLYDKEVTCPVCGHTFKVRAVKTSGYKVIKKDSDFYLRYAIINPYFYDVWICNDCGYASIKTDFPKIREYQKEIILKEITPKWRKKSYPEIYDVNVAIERYKLSLYNFFICNADSSKKAMNCLKLAWMYRTIDDKESELTFLKQAIQGFNDAYMNENLPIYGMDQGTIMYLIGELYRRVGDEENAMSWFSRTITTQGIEQKIKDMARDQKDLIKECEVSQDENIEDEDDESDNEGHQKKGFFSRFFK